ncbi:hypothetical protein [Corynebacterium sp. Marseille-Q2516]
MRGHAGLGGRCVLPRLGGLSRWCRLRAVRLLRLLWGLRGRAIAARRVPGRRARVQVGGVRRLRGGPRGNVLLRAAALLPAGEVPVAVVAGLGRAALARRLAGALGRGGGVRRRTGRP